MTRRRIILALAGVAFSAAAFAMLLPKARRALEVLMAQDDPARLSDVQLGKTLGPADAPQASAVVEQNITQALHANDADLANSFVALAGDKNIPISKTTSDEVAAAVAADQSTVSMAKKFASGLVTGEVDDAASLTGTVAGDLFVFGDTRDVIREGKHLVMGENVDRLVLGLASAGIAVTAATYVSAGGAAPLRAGLSMVKDARKVGRLGAGLTEWTGRAVRDVIDTPVLQQAVASASLAHPSQTVGAVKAAFKAEKAGALVRLAKDVGRVGEKAGAKGALDVLRISDGPKDVARAARLAESKGSQTRAIVKILGRGALLLTAGAFNLAWWVFGALLAVVGFLFSIKATTERLTLSWIQRAKLKRARRELAARERELANLAQGDMTAAQGRAA
ncbi:MAG: LapA family protein [Bradyrhizobiaceae bacterium]|nr:MAG: LapA family protein [Bradyrhizobiaceae bacterium]